jgi:hypothetical protein
LAEAPDELGRRRSGSENCDIHCDRLPARPQNWKRSVPRNVVGAPGMMLLSLNAEAK